MIRLQMFAIVSTLLCVAPAQALAKAVCSSVATPAGWVIVNWMINPAQCGGSTGGIQNMKEIVQISDKPIGFQIRICPQPLPAGWKKIDEVSDAAKCGSPSPQVPHNVMIIQRVSK